MAKLAARAVDQFGAIDVMVNNAGVMPLSFYADHAEAASAWDRCIDINLKGVLHGIIVVHDQMIEQGRGHIVNISSIYGNYPVAGAAVYGATKAAVNVLSEALRQESQGRIKVTTIRPTGVPTTGLGAGVINPAAVFRREPAAGTDRSRQHGLFRPGAGDSGRSNRIRHQSAVGRLDQRPHGPRFRGHVHDLKGGPRTGRASSYLLVETEFAFDDTPVAPIIGTFDDFEAVPEPSMLSLIGWGVGALVML